MKGRVYLVGAGPGDPELLTVKALRLLKTADAVLHDDLVSPEILALVSSVARLHNVGKRCGAKKIRQEEINVLMVAFASAGASVVRLKSGDPLIFGRTGEEVEALRHAGIDYEIVPGITAAFGAAAAAKIPLTHRRFSSALIFLTGHAAANSGETDWRKFVSSGATLVIYMPGSSYHQLAARLKAAGVVADTPCAIVSRAATKGQETHVTVLADLSQAPPLPAPTMLLVGEVVRFAQRSAEGSPFADVTTMFSQLEITAQSRSDR